MKVSNDEMVSVRDAQRGLAGKLEAVEKKGSKLVLTKHGKMVAVLVSVETYEQMEKK